MRLQLRSSLVKPAKKVIGKQRLTVLVNVSFPAPKFESAFRARTTQAGIAQLVEHDLAKVGVASSSLVSRSKFFFISKVSTAKRVVGDVFYFF